MIYLASPFTHEDKAIENKRYHQVCIAAGRYIQAGHFVYAPIAHSRAIATSVSLPTDYSYWCTYNSHMISLCSEVIVLTLEGWEESKGVQAEITLARALNKPIRYQNYMEAPSETPVLVTG